MPKISQNIAIHKYNFFKDLPLDCLLHVFAHLPVKELYDACRSLNRNTKAVAEISLFSRTDSESFEYQTKLVENLALTAFKYNTDDFLPRLNAQLFTFLKRPNLDPGLRLGGLIALARINNLELDLKNVSVQPLHPGRLNIDRALPLTALKCIPVLFSKAKKSSFYQVWDRSLDTQETRLTPRTSISVH